MIAAPPDETGPVPVRREAVEPHLFGVTPPLALLVLAIAALALGAVLLVLDARIAGAVVLAVGVALVAAFLAVARRKPDSGVARGSAAAFDRARDRASLALSTYAARSRARRRVAALRAELLELEQQRRDALLALGQSVYERDDEATESLRAEVTNLGRRQADKEAEVTAVVEQVRREPEQARLEVQPTEMVEVPGGPGPGEATPPQPAPVPEPYPPPDEGDPPQPARVPEPYPPDEGTPPAPARIPEPGGDATSREPGGGSRQG